MKKADEIKKSVKDSYAKIAQSSGCCCSSLHDSNLAVQRQSGELGYSDEERNLAPSGSNLGLGCGNPTAIASLKEGETVLDLGCGAGFDVFLAAKRVGETGKVIGVDMTEEMLDKAKANAEKGKYKNVQFKKGDIEKLPLPDNSVDVVISNCVINLVPDKKKVLSEAFRVLVPGGRLMVSDVMLIKALPEELKEDKELLTGCIAGAIFKDEYLGLLEEVGFAEITIHKESPSYLKEYAISVTYSAQKPEKSCCCCCCDGCKS